LEGEEERRGGEEKGEHGQVEVAILCGLGFSILAYFAGFQFYVYY